MSKALGGRLGIGVGGGEGMRYMRLRRAATVVQAHLTAEALVLEAASAQ